MTLWELLQLLQRYTKLMLLVLFILFLPGCSNRPHSPTPLPIKTSPVAETQSFTVLQELENSYLDLSGDFSSQTIMRKLMEEEKSTRQQQEKESEKKLEKLLKLGNIYLSLGEFRKAGEIARSIAEEFPGNIRSLCFRGMVAFYSGDFTSGAGLIQMAINKDKKSPEPHIVMGEIWTSLWNFPGARSEYERALALDGKNPYLYVSYGDFSMAEEEPGRAEEMYRKALELAPEEPVVKEKLGSLCILLKKRQEGMKLLGEVRALSPRDPALLYKILSSLESSEASALCSQLAGDNSFRDRDLFMLIQACMLAKEGKPGKSEKIMKEAGKRLPESATTNLLMALVLMKQGKYAETMKLLSESIRKYPSDDCFYALSSIIYFRKNDLPHALVYNGISLQIQPVSSKNRILQCLLLSHFKKMQSLELDEEMKKYEKALSSSKDKASLYHAMGEISLLRKNYEKALLYYGKAAEANKDENFFKRKLAELLVSIKKQDAAGIILKEAIKSNPQDNLSRLQLAHLYIAGNNLEAALRELDEACRVNPGDSIARYFKGIVYKKQKKYYEALFEFKTALSLEPLIPDVLFDMAETYEAIHKPDAAVFLYRKYDVLENRQFDEDKDKIVEARRRIDNINEEQPRKGSSRKSP